jgi:hypothetical protein
MNFDGLIYTLPNYFKLFIAAFVIMLSVGYFTGLFFVKQTDSIRPDGIVENYLGNEEVENAATMKFEKGEVEMLTILHTHVLSISFIFFLLGGLVGITALPKNLKTFLMVEPFLSILLTFGGIYLMWKGLTWMKYVVMISGMLMTAVFILSAGIVLFQLSKKK